MGRASGSTPSSVQISEPLRITSLLFADDVVLFASSGNDLDHALGQFAAVFEAAGMRVSTSETEAMVLYRKVVDCSLRVGSNLLLKWRSLSI